MTNDAGTGDGRHQRIPFWKRLVRGLDKTSNAALITFGLFAPTLAFSFWFYPEPSLGAIVFLIVILVVPFFAYALLRVLWNRKLWIGLATSIILWVVYPVENYVSMRLYVSLRGSTMASFASDILSDRKIWRLSACESYSKWLNCYNTNPDDSAYGDLWHEYFADCLIADSIPMERVDRYIDQLRDLNIQEFWIAGDKVVFLSETLARNNHGFVYSATNDSFSTRDFVFRGMVQKVPLIHVSDRLYCFSY